MILELRLKNFASISAEVEFSKGFNVVIGETGAGKSLLLSSIEFLKGGKNAPPVEDGSFVEAVFEIDGEEVIVRKEVKNGRVRCFLNDARVPQKVLSEKLTPLISFQSQRESIQLFKPSYQLSIIDSFSENWELLKKYSEVYSKCKKLEEEIKELKEKEQEKEKKLDFIKFQIEEIRQADLKEGEEEELLELKKLLEKKEKIEEVKKTAEFLISEGEPNVLSMLSTVIAKLEEIEEIDKAQNSLSKLQNAVYEIEDALSEILSVETPAEEVSLEEVENRLYLIEKLKRKYGRTVGEILEHLSKLEKELESLENAEVFLEEKEKELNILKSELAKISKELSERRFKKAKEFEKLIKNNLNELGMKDANFKITFEKIPFSPTGTDKVAFLFTGNPKLPLDELSKSISGGELSRFLLSVLSVLKVSQSVMVFDEIDAGMSGKILSKVAEKLKEISKNHQVIAVTHSPQVASAGDKVFKVFKTENGINVCELNKEQKIREIAIMISGEETPSSLKTAEDLIKRWEE